MRNCLLLFFCFTLLAPNAGLAQEVRLWPRSVDSSAVQLKPELFKTASELLHRINTHISGLQRAGYLSASADSFSIVNNDYYVYFFTGKQYRWSKLTITGGSLPPKAGIAASDFINKPLNPFAFAALTEKVIRYYEQNGYPFVRLWLEHIESDANNALKAEMHIDPGLQRKIDTVVIDGSVAVSRTFLQRYLDIPQKSIYDETKMEQISAKLRELPFLQESRPWTVRFRPYDTRVNLHLKSKSANTLNAFLGLMPNNLQAGKLLVTADVQTELHNVLGRGERLAAGFQNLQVRSPRLTAAADVPYLFGTVFGVDADFDMFRYDLAFRKVAFKAGLRRQTSAYDYVKLFYEALSNRLIEVDSATVIATKKLPANIDTRANGLGLAVQHRRTDYKFNPRKGYEITVSTIAYKRTVLLNNGITGLQDGSGFDYARLYDTVSKKGNQYKVTADMAAYLPLSKGSSLKFAYAAGYIYAPQLFRNELFQIGGFRRLRGFDEQSIFADQYHVATVELRAYLGLNSFVGIFSDNAYVETKFLNYARSAWFNGFGMSTALETKTGIFSLAVAWGRSSYLPLRFRESKLSFGYIAVF